jgi:hypothetical protein
MHQIRKGAGEMIVRKITERGWAQGAASGAGDVVPVGESLRELLPMVLRLFMRGAAPVRVTS